MIQLSRCAAVLLLLSGCGSAGGNDDRSAARVPPASTFEPRPARDRPAPAPTPVLAPLPLAAPAPSAARHAAFARTADGWTSLLYLCDGVEPDHDLLVTAPDASGVAWLSDAGGVERRPVRLSEEDPGAGQVLREIRRPDGSRLGMIHSVNPGMLGVAEETTLPTLSSVTVGGVTTPCRWMPRGRALLILPRRSVLVTAAPGGSYTYRSFDDAKAGAVIDTGGWRTSTPTTEVAGGRLAGAARGREAYEFRAGPWTYRVEVSASAAAPGASVAVVRDGRPAQSTPALAYEIAARRVD